MIFLELKSKSANIKMIIDNYSCALSFFKIIKFNDNNIFFFQKVDTFFT